MNKLLECFTCVALGAFKLFFSRCLLTIQNAYGEEIIMGKTQHSTTRSVFDIYSILGGNREHNSWCEELIGLQLFFGNCFAMSALNVSFIGGDNATENGSISQINRSNFSENGFDNSDSFVPLWIIICNILVLTVSACVNFVFMLVLLCSRRNGNFILMIPILFPFNSLYTYILN